MSRGHPARRTRLLAGAVIAATALLCSSQAAGFVRAQSGSSRVLHTQDIYLIAQLRADDGSGNLADVTDQLLTLATASSGESASLGAGLTVTLAPGLSARALDGGKPLPNVTVDPAVVTSSTADGSAIKLVAVVASADIEFGGPNLGPDSRIELDVSNLPALAVGTAGDVSYAMLQALSPADPAGEAGKSDLGVLASRWQNGSVQMVGAPGDGASQEPAILAQVPVQSDRPAPSAVPAANYRQATAVVNWGAKDIARAPTASSGGGDPFGIVGGLSAVGNSVTAPFVSAGQGITNMWNAVQNFGKPAPKPAAVLPPNDPCPPPSPAGQPAGASAAPTRPDVCFDGEGQAQTNYGFPEDVDAKTLTSFKFRVTVKNGAVSGNGRFQTTWVESPNGRSNRSCNGSVVNGSLVLSGTYTLGTPSEPGGHFELQFLPTAPSTFMLSCSNGTTTEPVDYWNAWHFLSLTVQGQDGKSGTAAVNVNLPSAVPDEYDPGDYPGQLKVTLHAPRSQ